MSEIEHKKFVDNAKNEYKNIGYVECPAFDNEKIVFSNSGFNHLIRKGGELRPMSVQVERLTLAIKYAPQILRVSSKYTTFLKDTNQNNHIAYFWSFISRHEGLNIRIVVRQLENGPKHFFSIHLKSAQTPPK